MTARRSGTRAGRRFYGALRLFGGSISSGSQSSRIVARARVTASPITAADVCGGLGVWSRPLVEATAARRVKKRVAVQRGISPIFIRRGIRSTPNRIMGLRCGAIRCTAAASRQAFRHCCRIAVARNTARVCYTLLPTDVTLRNAIRPLIISIIVIGWRRIFCGGSMGRGGIGRGRRRRRSFAARGDG